MNDQPATIEIRRRTLAVLAVAAITAVSCVRPALPAPHAGGVDPDTAPAADEARYVAAGPYAAGVTTVELEPGRKMEVWYPAPPAATAGHVTEAYHIRSFLAPALSALLDPNVDPPFETGAFRDVAAAPGRFPLVLFSHGAMSFRLQSTFLTTHLASWGFVVMSPDYFERGLQSLGGTPPAPTRSNDEIVAMAMAAVSSLDASGTLAGRVDTSRLFPIGHSAGGFQSTALASTRTDVQSWISMSAGIAVEPTLFNWQPQPPAGVSDPSKSSMWLVGANDGVVQPGTVLDGYAYSAGERKLVVIPGAGHNNAMSDICEIGRDQGGLIGLATSGGLPLPDFVVNLANDGCPVPPNSLSAVVWPVVRQFVTAELRYRSGLDAQPVGLGSGVASQFAGVVPTYQHSQ